MRATIVDIKNRTGLSLATISKYLNGGTVRPENKEKIDEAVRTLNYRVNETARSLVTNRTKTIGVIVYTVENLFAGTMMHYIGEYFRQHGYGMFICDSNNNPEIEAENVKNMIQKNVDGILMIPVGLRERYLPLLSSAGIPLVCLDRRFDDQSFDSVTINNRESSASLVEILVRNGHSRIGYIGSEAEYTGRERAAGFREAMEQRGLSICTDYLYLKGMNLATGYNGMKHLMGLSGPPTAVVMSNYEITLGAIMALRENGIEYPEKVSIVAFDNLMLSDIVSPRITIAVQPMEKMANSASELLLSRIREDKKDSVLSPIRHIVYPAAIYEFESVKKINGMGDS